jgi:hypothetical protein
VAQQRRVVDVRTGTVLADDIVPEEISSPGLGVLSLRRMAIAGSGQIVVASYTLPSWDQSSSSLVTVRRLDGSIVWEGLIAGYPMRIEVSPSGRYFVVDTMQKLDPNGTLDGVTSVFTMFGDEVDYVFAYDTILATAFLGNGELAVCAPGIGLFTWQLYGPIRPVADQTDPWFGPNRSIGTYCGIIGV